MGRHIGERQMVVYCPNCGEDNTKGYVTKFFADMRRSENEGERMDVEDLMTSIGLLENPHKGKTEKQLLDELGFGG